MENVRLMIVDDEPDIVSMLQIYFDRKQYGVTITSRGEDAVAKAIENPPDLIILDIILPDIDGYEVCRRLRHNFRTKFVPIIFLTQKNDRKDKLQGLEMGADDYITKPFDIEELQLRIQNALNRSERESFTDAQSRLPSVRIIEDYLRQVIKTSGWSFMDIHINEYQSFKEKYGFLAASDVLRFIAMTMQEVCNEFGSVDDFVGHAGGENFVIITQEDVMQTVYTELLARFNKDIATYYNFTDRDQGFMMLEKNGEEEQHNLMTLSIGTVSPSQYRFADIREITEIAADERKKAAAA
ncbi:MAG: response regulator [Anaerolineaceae bacterium]|nr:response regulator [Anaerolineaceae bacterium]